jgi:hypothetical protein
MIFMSQSGITDATLEPAWAEWYREHLRIMRTVDGIDSARRYLTRSPSWPPSLAMYSLRSLAVFDDPHYQRIRGMGEWLALIDRRHYKRNVFEGLESAPDVLPGQALLVTDRESPGPAVDGVCFSWLRCVGLDRSTPYRGIAVVSEGQAAALDVDGMAVYLPSA